MKWLWAVLLVLLWSVHAHAQSQEAEAERAFAQGVQDYEAGRFEAAAVAFEDAGRHSPRGRASYNAGLAWEQAGEAARAADAFELSVGIGDLPSPLAKDARARLARLKRTVGYVRVVDPVGGLVSVEHVEAAAAPVAFHLPPGTHTVTLETSAGAPTTKQIVVRAGQSLTVTFPQQATKLAKSEPLAAPPSTPPTAPPQADQAQGSSLMPWAFVALGASAAATGAAVVLGINTLDARDEYEASDYRDGEARDRTLRYRTWTNVAWAGAGALAVTGGVLTVLWLSEDTGSSKVSVGPDAVWLSGEF